jgi:aspartate aminotransferase
LISESKRAGLLPPLLTINIKERYLELIKKGEEIIDLSIGDTDFKPPNILKEGLINAFNRGLTHYTLSQGILELREGIAEKHGVNPDEILICAGGKEGIFSLFLSIINDKDNVLIPEPQWPAYNAYAHLCQAKIISIKTRIEELYEPSIEEIKHKINSKTKILIINSPNNPTGTVYSKSFMRGVTDLADDYGFLLLSDEIYSNYVYSGDFLSACNLGENVIVIDGFSKTYGMTGLRLCYLIGKKEIVAKINKIHGYIIGNAPSLTQYAAIHILNKKEYIERNKAEMKERSRLAFNILKNTKMLKIYRPKGAFYIFPKYKQKISSVDICNDILIKKKVALVPGSAFKGEGCFRIAFSQPQSLLEKGLIRIRDYFNEEEHVY